MKSWHRVFVILIALSIVAPLASVHAANGLLKGTFKYKDPATGAERVLNSGFVYLRDASKPAPMEKFPSKADHILGPTMGAPFMISVPEGKYYLRLLERKTLGSVARPFGPPEEGDYTWVQRIPVTITAGGTLDLGTVYAAPFTYAAPITIKGTLKTTNGTLVKGHYVRAQTVPCTIDGEFGIVNQCGPDKFLAITPTDANGSFTLYLQNPGTYYLYTSPCLTADWTEYTGNNCGFTAGPTLTVSRGDVRTVNLVIWSYY